MTPHIQAKKSDFAPIVLMPGDPLRAQWIAQTFLSDVKQINGVRGMLGFTGKYKNVSVSVMGHGMGNPSIGIYAYELFAKEFYDVQTIIRIGSCGALIQEIKVRDVIIAQNAYADSNFADLMNVKHNNHVLSASTSLVQLAQTVAHELKIATRTCQAYSSDVFYAKESLATTIARSNAQVVEMEAFALYANAIYHQKQALCLLTVSDSLVTHEGIDSQARQTSFESMVKLALEMVVKISSK